MNDLLIIDMLPTYGLLFYLLISVFVFVGCRGLRRRTSDRGLLRFAVGAFLVVSALGAVFAALVYIMAAPLAQPDMVDFYRTYRPGALIFLLDCSSYNLSSASLPCIGESNLVYPAINALADTCCLSVNTP